MESYVTPGFSWALPDDEQKEPSPASTKPMVNPLLKQSFLSPPGPVAPDFRVPFSPVQNVGMRQRRQNGSSLANDAARKPVRPPTASFLDNGSVVSNEIPRTAPVSNATTLSMFAGSAAHSVPRLINDSLERWVLVYGFSTSAQYESLMRRFESFGKIVSHRSGGSNWVALEYESLLQTEKALSQASLPMDGVVVGVTRLTLSLRQSLDWNSASTLSTTQQVPPSFQKRHELKEEDVLLLTSGSPRTQAQFEIGAASSSGNVCGRLLAWWFGWERYDME